MRHWTVIEWCMFVLICAIVVTALLMGEDRRGLFYLSTSIIIVGWNLGVELRKIRDSIGGLSKKDF